MTPGGKPNSLRGFDRADDGRYSGNLARLSMALTAPNPSAGWYKPPTDIYPYMRTMAGLLSQGRPVGGIMGILRMEEARMANRFVHAAPTTYPSNKSAYLSAACPRNSFSSFCNGSSRRCGLFSTPANRSPVLAKRSGAL